MKKFFFLLMFAAAVPQPGAAQSLNALRQGVRIEVTPVHGKSQRGTLISLKTDSLFYAPDRSASADGLTKNSVVLGLVDVRTVRVSRGRSALAGALSKGLLGTGIGILSGAILGAASYSESKPTCAANSYFCIGCIVICSRGQAAGLGGVLGGGVGLVAGSIYGATHGNERWESVDLPRR